MRLNLTNYTGVIFLASNGAPSMRAATSARGVKRRSGSVPKTPAPHDPAESDTVKKPKGQQGFAQASSAGFPGAASAAGEASELSESDSEASCDGEELEWVKYNPTQNRAGGGLASWWSAGDLSARHRGPDQDAMDNAAKSRHEIRDAWNLGDVAPRSYFH